MVPFSGRSVFLHKPLKKCLSGKKHNHEITTLDFTELVTLRPSWNNSLPLHFWASSDSKLLCITRSRLHSRMTLKSSWQEVLNHKISVLYRCRQREYFWLKRTDIKIKVNFLIYRTSFCVVWWHRHRFLFLFFKYPV